MWEEWVYASAATSGVKDYWIRVPVKALVKSMAGLDFELWKTEGQPVLRKGIPTLNGLAHQSSSFQDFLSQNDLREVPVSVAQKSSRPGSATLITGEMYALLCQHVGSVTGDPGVFVKTIDALFAMREWTDPSILNPHYDHLIYFLLAMLQGHNADIDELETILLKKLDKTPSILALQACQNWAQFFAAKSGPPDRDHGKPTVQNYCQQSKRDGRPSGGSRSLTVIFPRMVAPLPRTFTLLPRGTSLSVLGIAEEEGEEAQRPSGTMYLWNAITSIHK